MHQHIKGTECERCGGEIGTENYVICFDGIKQKPVTFHHRCKPPMSDVQQHYGATLAPGHLGMQPRNMG